MVKTQIPTYLGRCSDSLGILTFVWVVLTFEFFFASSNSHCVTYWRVTPAVETWFYLERRHDDLLARHQGRRYWREIEGKGRVKQAAQPNKKTTVDMKQALLQRNVGFITLFSSTAFVSFSDGLRRSGKKNWVQTTREKQHTCTLQQVYGQNCASVP